MLRGFRWFALAGAVAIAALVGPTAALADSCPPGSVYSIYCQPAPTKAKPTKPKITHKNTTPPATTTPYVPTTTVQTPVPPPPVKHVKHHHHKHHAVSPRVKHPSVKPKHITPAPVLADSPQHESGLGSAFDLGSGPMLLFALLAGTVLLLLGTGGVRSWRNRHRV